MERGLLVVSLRRFLLRGGRLRRARLLCRRGSDGAFADLALQLVNARDQRFQLQAFLRFAGAKRGRLQRKTRLRCPFHVRFAFKEEIQHTHQPDA